MNDTSVIIVQRQTLDWAAQTPESFRPVSEDFCRLWGRSEDYVFRLMQLWDETFSIGYFETRARLKAISTCNLLSVSDVEFVPYGGYKNIPDKRAFYLFMDDDDWAGPDLGIVLGAQSPDAHNALLWRAVNIGGPQQEFPAFVWGLNGRCMTNNYAIGSEWLNYLQRLHEVSQHSVAAATLVKMSDVVQLDAAITASNKSPCSSVSLDRGLGGILSSEKLARLVNDYLEQMAALSPEHLHIAQWVMPLAAETAALFREVSASRIK